LQNFAQQAKEKAKEQKAEITQKAKKRKAESGDAAKEGDQPPSTETPKSEAPPAGSQPPEGDGKGKENPDKMPDNDILAQKRLAMAKAAGKGAVLPRE